MAKAVGLILFMALLALVCNAQPYEFCLTWEFEDPGYNNTHFPEGYIWDTINVVPGQWGQTSTYPNWHSSDWSCKFYGRTGWLTTRPLLFNAGENTEISGWLYSASHGTVDVRLYASMSPDGPWDTAHLIYNAQNENVNDAWTREAVSFIAPTSGYWYFHFIMINNGNPAEGYLDDISLCYENNPYTPVELSSFSAVLTADCLVKLNWVTQSETGVNGYYILRGNTDQLGLAQTVSQMIPATNTSITHSYEFTDTDLYDSGTYYYWLQNVDLDGSEVFHGPVSVYYDNTIDDPAPPVPVYTELKAIYPNPFNPLAFIPFSLAETSPVSLLIFNSRGQIVRHFELGTKTPGQYRVAWDGRDYLGRALPSGVYAVRLTAGEHTFVRKTMLLK